MDSNVGALKNKIAQLRRLVADLRGELGEVLTRQNDLERSFEEQLDCHREDLDWDRLNDKNLSMSFINSPEQDKNFATSHSPFERNGWYRLLERALAFLSL